MSDQFERELREHLQREARQVSAFPRHLSQRIRDQAGKGRDFGLLPQLALSGAMAVFVGLLVIGIVNLRALQAGNPQLAATATPSAKASAQPSSSPSVSAAPSASASANGIPYACVNRQGGSSSTTGAHLTRVQASHHPDGDWIVFQFDSASLPAYTLAQQNSATFTRPASGQQVILLGSAGLKIQFLSSDGHTAYSGPYDIKPSTVVVREVTQVGDYEGYLSWGVGLSQSACNYVQELSGPSRLLIKIQTP